MEQLMRRLRRLLTAGVAALGVSTLAACMEAPWNNPYPATESRANILYTSFQERPKHLDPARAYSSNEYTFIAQIYEPPLQYHYLKRPYTLTPLAATAVPEPEYYDAQGNRLPADAAIEDVATSVYEIRIQAGIFYQPHPAFARDDSGNYRYHGLGRGDLEGIHSLGDFNHTGTRELVAADYVHQIKRLAHPGVHSPILGLMSDYIRGLSALRKALVAAQKKYPDEHLDLTEFDLSGVEVVDRYTYRITLDGKYPQFVYWLAMPFFAPMPPEAVEFYHQPGMKDRNLTLDWWPVGSGPFMLGENNPNRRMVLKRNPHFHGERYPAAGEPGDRARGLLADAGEPLPFLEKIVFSLEKESIPRWNKFLQGYYDISGISSDSFDQAIQVGAGGDLTLTPAMERQGIRLAKAVAPSSFYLGFNMLDEVVGGLDERSRKLRQAVSIAIDYEEYISIFLNGRGIAAQGPLPPGIFGHREGEAGINPVVYQWQDGRAQRKPLAEAKALLAEAGYPEGVDAETGEPLILHLDFAGSGPDDKARLEWFRKQLAKIDVQLVVRNTDYNRFQDKMASGNAQLFLWGWNADYPDPENFLFLLYGPNGKVEHNGENAANYDDPEFNRLFEKMKNMDNGRERQAIIDEMLSIARRDAPWVWGLHPKQFSLYHEWYRNTKPNLMANNTFKYVKVDPEARADKRMAWNEPILWPLGGVALILVGGTVPAVISYRRRQRLAVKEQGDAS